MPAPTLHDFVLKLLSDASSREAFDADPVAALRDAGLSDVNPEDVVDAIPLVLDFASANGDVLRADAHGLVTGSSGHVWGGAETAHGGGSGAVDVTTDGVVSHGGFGIRDVAGGTWEYDAGLDGVTGSSAFETPLGTVGYAFAAGPEGFGGAVSLPSLDTPDALGKGGDMVTGTVAGYVTQGADTFSDVLTEGASALSGGIISGAGNADGLITDGATQLTGALEDPTSLQVPTVSPAAVPDLTAGLPVDLPAVPALPAAPGLPELGDLPLNLPKLPVDLDLPELPGVPAIPGLPEVPSLPSLPGADIVNGAVSDVTGHVPVVGDLTDGVLDNLQLGH